MESKLLPRWDKVATCQSSDQEALLCHRYMGGHSKEAVTALFRCTGLSALALLCGSLARCRSARELLEDNKQLIVEKKEQKAGSTAFESASETAICIFPLAGLLTRQALARKNSRELVQKLIEEDRVKSEGIKDASRASLPVTQNPG